MKHYELTKSNIDDYIEKIGVSVRPVIEQKLDKTHLFQFCNDLIDSHPNLFESIVQSPTNFSITKKFVFPGKGEFTPSTFTIPKTGPILILPRKISLFNEETDLGKSEDIAIACFKIFRKHFPHKIICRVGQVNEYIFTLGNQQSVSFLAERFTTIKNIPSNGEIRLRLNRPHEDYNRIIDLQPVLKQELTPQPTNTTKIKAYGLRVAVDVNNRDMSRNLNEDDIRRIIQTSIQYNSIDLYKFLNHLEGEE